MPTGWWPSCSCYSSGSGSQRPWWPRNSEISERTARRDLEALCVAGLPVYSERDEAEAGGCSEAAGPTYQG